MYNVSLGGTCLLGIKTSWALGLDHIVLLAEAANMIGESCGDLDAGIESAVREALVGSYSVANVAQEVPVVEAYALLQYLRFFVGPSEGCEYYPDCVWVHR